MWLCLIPVNLEPHPRINTKLSAHFIANMHLMLPMCCSFSTSFPNVVKDYGVSAEAPNSDTVFNMRVMKAQKGGIAGT